MQFVGWMLGNFDSIEAVKRGIKSVRLTALIPEAGTVHYRLADKSGKQIVIESIDGKIKIFDNPVGVLTNSPDFQWHLKNSDEKTNLISATQWTSATDMTNGVFYYKTDTNYRIRSVELKNINFAKVKYQVMPLDRVNEQPIEALTIK